METTMTLPQLGEGITKGTVAKVIASEGGSIAVGDPVIEIEAGKAVVPVPASVGGTVKKMLVKSGQEVTVGEAILVIETSDDAAKVAPAQPKSEPSETPQAQVEQKRTEAPAHKEVSSEAPSEAQAMPSPIHYDEDAEDISAGPAARKLARELGIDLRWVRGSGKGGRIDQDDVRDYVRALNAFISKASHDHPIAQPGGVSETTPPSISLEESKTEPMSGLRKAIAVAMTTSWTTIPHVFQFHEIEVTRLLSALEDLKTRGIRLTVTTVLMKAVAELLREMPKFNASLDLANKQIVFHQQIHLGIAVDTEAGLIVPVAKDVDKKDMIALAEELRLLGEKARNRTLTPDELSGAGFNISNLGSLGAGHFTPLIVPPQVAVLGVGRSKTAPIYENGQWVPRQQLPVSLSYDHRLIDGADAARFLSRLTEILSDIALIPMIQER